jgi:hypothetical protein
MEIDILIHSVHQDNAELKTPHCEQSGGNGVALEPWPWYAHFLDRCGSKLRYRLLESWGQVKRSKVVRWKIKYSR